MAAAKKCDRCGKLYELYDVPDKQIFGHNINGVDLTHDHDYIKEFDLCPDCMEALLVWLKNGKKEKENE